jgi:hypothetical protein
MLTASIKRTEDYAENDPQVREWLAGRHVLTIDHVREVRRDGSTRCERQTANYLVTAEELEVFKSVIAALTL